MTTGKTYTINIKNLMQNADRTFFLFQEVPKVENDPSSKVFSNIYQITPSVTGESDGSSSAGFTVSSNFYAIFGTKRGGPKEKVETSSYKAIRLGPNGSVVAMTTTNNGTSPKWDVPNCGDDFDGAGGFKFISDGTFDGGAPTDIYIGVGAADPKKSGKIIPLQTWKAEPNWQSQLYPKVTYYVGTGNFEPGQFVDKKNIGKFVQIDFQTAAATEPVVNLNYTSNGSWNYDKDSGAGGVKVSYFG
ncbi:hypothetical protein BX600DRAFT_227400 [Xylariales sp. PMI_506]|nr:hypothetical protein BX600DRAFT_227400 [Xylariales sp. PMI_506]